MFSVDITSVIQEQVVLDERGQIKFRDHLVDPLLQEVPDVAASQVLQGTRALCQREDRLIEVFMLLVGLITGKQKNISGSVIWIK